MASALQKQLAAIAASSTHQLDLKAQKSAHGKSLLFDSKTAASQSFENLYLICCDGYRDLCALDSRFLQFSKSLFSEQSKVEDRTQMNVDENKKLDRILEAFITLIGPRLLLKPAQKALEWLVRRFRIHEYNTECLTLTYLPYHNSPQFLALLSILPAQPPPSLRFLHPYIQSPTNPPRRTIVYTAVNTRAFFDALQAYVVRVVQASHQASLMLSFWAGITLEAVIGIIDNASTGRRDIESQKTEELVLRVLPALNNCMQRKNGAETVAACYTIIAALAGKAELGDKILDSLMEAVILAHDGETLDACIACIALLAEQRTNATLLKRVEKQLLVLPQLVEKLADTAKQCRINRLALGCAVGALNHLVISSNLAKTFLDLLSSGLLNESHTRTVLSTLIVHIRDETPGSDGYSHLLDVAAKLCETPFFLDAMRSAAKVYNVDLEALGISGDLEVQDDNHVSEDEEMVDAEDALNDLAITPIELPQLKSKSFLEQGANEEFEKVAALFESAVSTKRTSSFLSLDALHQETASTTSLYLSFLTRVWCSSRPIPARVAALQAATKVTQEAQSRYLFQNIIPYLLVALTDSSTLVRRSAAKAIGSLSGQANTYTKSKLWGADMYGKKSSEISTLKQEDLASFFDAVLIPLLEESVMDRTSAIATIRDILEGSQHSKALPKHNLKAQTRTSILEFLASHVTLTPLLQARLALLPVFRFTGKTSDAVRTKTIIPLVRQWCELPSKDVLTLCTAESIDAADVDRKHLDVLVAKDASSVQLLKDIISGALSKSRPELVNAAFDRIHAFWASMKSELRLQLAQTLLDLTFLESNDGFEKLCCERSLEILRDVKLDSAILATFLDSVPSSLQMPEGPPTKKRRRTSRNEMARVELSSQDDVQRLLRKLTTVLELIEASNPGQHPSLFRSLFTIFGELPPLKQQSGSELVYLQSIILGSLAPIVDTLKQQSDTTEYQSAVRADLLIDCIRHSPSPQVQNSALLLIANLASWVPELILHNLMPIFTFLGSTLLRQQDDYSAQVVDKTISRVVPQLAASLRAKHKNFLSGVSDLLLSFTAAFEHIPLHRRLKLFSELARTLGPEDSLSAILALLADKYHNSKSQRRFSTELLLVFEPIHTLDAFKGYIELVNDAASPKRKVSDALFGLNEKNSVQIDSTIKNLLASLADLAGDERLHSHVGRVFRRKEDPHKPRAVFANIIETTIQLSTKVTSSPKLYDACRKVLVMCLSLLPTIDLVKTAELLLSNSSTEVQTAAINAVEVRAGTAVQNDGKSVDALLSFLPSLETTIQQSHDADAKAFSVGCIDRIVERFGKKDVSIVESVSRTIAGSEALSSSDNRMRILSLVCLTSITDVLEDEAISLLPVVLPTAFEYLADAIDENNSGLHNAVYELLSNIVERLGYMFSREYLDTALQLSHRSAEADLDESCDEQRRSFYTSVATHLGASEIFWAIQSTWTHALSHDLSAALQQLELLRATIDNQTKAKLVKSSPSLFSLLLQLFKLRKTIEEHHVTRFEFDEIDQLDSTLVESALAMVLKLNDATFRPFFVQLVDQEGPLNNVTFYGFLIAFFEKFKSIVTSYSSYIIEHVAKALIDVAADDADEDLREAVLDALQQAFQHDQDAFWQAPSHYGAVLKPLTNLLTINKADDITDDVIPTIVELAAASSSSLDNHRELNNILLRFMRSDSAATRLATVKCEQALTKRLGEEWLGLLPEMLPFISELREDDDEMVERETQRWISMVEGALGESLEGMLQ